MKYERLAVGLLALIILLAPFDYGLFNLQILTINLISSFLLIFIWMKFSIKKGEVSFYINPITISICFFFLLCFLSLTYSIHPYSSLTEVMRVFIYLTVFFISANFFSRKSFQKVFTLIAICMGFAAICGFGQYLFGKVPEPKSVFLYRGTFATYLLLTFPLVFSLKRYNPIFLWLGAFGFLAFIVTQSRSAWVSLIMGGLIFAPFAFSRARRGRIKEMGKESSFYKYRHFILIMAFVLLFIIYDCVFMDSALVKRAGTLFSPGNISSAQARVKYWDSAVKITKRYLPAGTGIQTFYLIYPSYKHPSFKRSSHHFAHNDYLQILSELGPLGLIAFLGIVFSFLLTLRYIIMKGCGVGNMDMDKNGDGDGGRGRDMDRDRDGGGDMHRDMDKKDEGLLLAIYFSSLAFFFQCGFEFNIYIPSLMILVYLYMGFVSKGNGKFIKIPIHSKRCIIVYPIFFALIVLSAFPYLGKVFMRKGDAAIKNGNIPDAIVSYRTSSFFSPLNSLTHRKLAGVYQSEGKVEEAVLECISAIRLNSFKKENHELLWNIVQKR